MLRARSWCSERRNSSPPFVSALSLRLGLHRLRDQALDPAIALPRQTWQRDLHPKAGEDVRRTKTRAAPHMERPWLHFCFRESLLL